MLFRSAGGATGAGTVALIARAGSITDNGQKTKLGTVDLDTDPDVIASDLWLDAAESVGETVYAGGVLPQSGDLLDQLLGTLREQRAVDALELKVDRLAGRTGGSIYLIEADSLAVGEVALASDDEAETAPADRSGLVALDAIMVDVESRGDSARLTLLAALDAGPAGSVSLRATGTGSVTQIDAPIQATGGNVLVAGKKQVGARNGLMFVNGGDLVIRAADGLAFGTWDGNNWVDAASGVSLDELGEGLVAAIGRLADGAFEASYAEGVITLGKGAGNAAITLRRDTVQLDDIEVSAPAAQVARTIDLSSLGVIPAAGRYVLGVGATQFAFVADAVVFGRQVSPGLIRIEGNQTFKAGQGLRLGVAGTEAGTFDRLEVTGTLTLNGKLDINYVEVDDGEGGLAPFVPQLGDAFEGLITAGKIENHFAASGGLFGYDSGDTVLEITQNDRRVRLEVIEPCGERSKARRSRVGGCRRGVAGSGRVTRRMQYSAHAHMLT